VLSFGKAAGHVPEHGGFQVNVGGNTDLKGAVVSSTQAAIDANANSLTTGSLTASAIDNRDIYKATAISVSAGTGGGSAGAAVKSGDQRSTTVSGISDGSLTVVNGSPDAALDRTVLTGTDSQNALAKTWDGQQLQQQVQAGASITAEFGQRAAKAVGDYAGSMRDRAKVNAEAAATGGDTAE
jgi:filamentous hemagglutinin